MHLGTVWVVPLAAGALGAAALGAAAAIVRRDVAHLQRSLRPLRVGSRPSRRLGGSRGGSGPGRDL